VSETIGGRSGVETPSLSGGVTPPHTGLIERVNSRLDRVLGFELHTIRGLAKMETRVGIALVVLLSMALGRLRVGQKDQMRSLLAPAFRQAA
jgi:hypothetical protein